VNGRVTSMGLLISPARKAAAVARYQRLCCVRAQLTQACRASIQKSLRSETHATDSTRKGCTAKSPAARALGTAAPVERSSMANRSTTLNRCSARLARWCALAAPPASWAISMCESQVSGCQFPSSVLVKA
jgi:hypothetical protein